jgi:Skp family chaperone for outer membrane proteins
MRAQLLVGAIFALGLTGCGWSSSDKPTASGAAAVAVIDLDEIARRLGSDKQMADAINQRQSALRQKLVELAAAYNEQIAEQQKTLPADQADQAEVTLAAWQQQANDNLNQVRQQAELDLRNHQAQLIQQFRDSVKPAARRIAQARGLTLIVTRNDSVVFDYTAAADITDEVVDELLASSATPAAQVAPPVTPTAATP